MAIIIITYNYICMCTFTMASESSSLSLQSERCSNSLCLRSNAHKLPSPQAANRVLLLSSTTMLDTKSRFSLKLNGAFHDLVSQICGDEDVTTATASKTSRAGFT